MNPIIKKIRVLHIITRLDPGGSAMNTLETVRRLDPERFDVELLSGKTVDPDGQSLGFISLYGLRCSFIEDLVRNIHLIKDVKAWIALYTRIKQGQYDIVHTHSSKAGIMGRWAARLAGVRHIVHTPHGHVFYGYFSSVLTGIFIMAERFTVCVTDRLIELTTKGVEEHLTLGIGRKEQWSVIPSGIDLEMFRSDEDSRRITRREWQVSEDDILVVSVGRLEEVKGQVYLINALPQVLKECPAVKLMLVGDGHERSSLEEHSMRLGVKDRVIFAGFCEDVRPYLNAADIFALASLNEGMGRAVVEAMACGKPVILSRVGGMQGLIEDGKEGFLVSAKDGSAWAGALGKLASDHERREGMAASALRRANEYFSVEVMVKKIELVYEDLLK